MKTAAIISLGCPRNLVDSEVILGSLKRRGFRITEIGKGADICIINTCSFIKSAKEESIDTILEAAQLKKEGRIKTLVVCGCLPQLYKETLLKEIPAIDLVAGSSDFHRIGSILSASYPGKRRSIVSRHPAYLYDENSPRYLLTPEHYAYVKISEGCDNLCSYCIISKLRGAFRSRPARSIIDEIKRLSRGGALKEVDLIGQDTTAFGRDRYGESRFAGLLKEICALKNSVKWVRILYTHPAHYTDELISTIESEERICRYLDLPVQHISERILKGMNRCTTRREIIDLISKLRRRIKGLGLRTSIIVGFPGETEKEFKELLDFIRDTRFERLGAFIYSPEEGTRAYKFKDQIPDKVKGERFDELMKLQKTVSADINKAFLGREITVLIDEKVNNTRRSFMGRTEWDAPEVDGTVYVSGKGIKIGGFYKVRINDTLEYDLVGEKA